MTHEERHVIIRIPNAMYLELVQLLESRIRSERARANAFRCRDDRSNAYTADMRRQCYQSIRDAIEDSLQPGSHADA